MSLKMPAEHGAWGLLAVPFVCAVAVAGAWNFSLLLAAVCVLALFLLRGSMDAQGGWKTWRDTAHLGLAATAVAAGGPLLLIFERGQLILLGIFAAALFALQQWLAVRRPAERSEKRSLAAEMAGVALLSLSAPAAWIAGRGRLEREGVELWLLNLLFFLGGVLYVKFRVRGLLAHRPFPNLRERVSFAWPVFAYHILLLAFLAGWTLLDSRPAALAIAFAPGILRACGLLFQLGRRFPIKRLGWTEVAHSAVFAALLILAFRVVL